MRAQPGQMRGLDRDIQPGLDEDVAPALQAGQTLRRLTTVCAFLVLASAGAASLLEAKVRDGTLLRLASALRDPGEPLAVPPGKDQPLRAELRQTTLDYQPTGSIPVSLAAPVVLDPCTGARK